MTGRVRTEFRKGELSERNMNDVLRSLYLRVEKLERDLSGDVEWLAPALQGGFTNLGGGNSVAGYHRDVLGYVHLKGVVTNVAGTSAGTRVFTLGPGNRPARTELFPVFSTSGAAQFVSVDPDGGVFVQITVAAGASISLALSFLAEL